MQNGRAAGRRALQRLARIRNVRAGDKHATRGSPNYPDTNLKDPIRTAGWPASGPAARTG
jgi:hypothetical protein